MTGPAAPAQARPANLARRKWRARNRGTPGPGRDGKRGRPAGDTLPTPETLAKRIALAGPDGDPAMTATPLDVLETRRLIAAQSAAVGRRLALAHRLVFGAISPPARATGDPGATGGMPAEAVVERAEREYTAALVLLSRIGGATRDTVVDVAVYLRWPRVLRIDDHRARRELDRLKAGLGALVSGR